MQASSTSTTSNFHSSHLPPVAPAVAPVTNLPRMHVRPNPTDQGGILQMHGLAGSEPDYTFNAEVFPNAGNTRGESDYHQVKPWTVREERTLQAEHAMFDVLRQHATSGTARSWAEIEPVLVAFNATKENEGNSSGRFEGKLKILQDALNDPALGLKAKGVNGSLREFDLASVEKDAYGRRVATDNRNNLLKKLKEVDFPGVCLPGGSLCKPY